VIQPPVYEALIDDAKRVAHNWVSWYQSVTGGGKVSQPTVGASPFTYHNVTNVRQEIVLTGGTVSSVQFSRDNITFYTVSSSQGIPIILSSGDYLKITHTGAPTMTVIPL
jgi:hypothetical protein